MNKTSNFFGITILAIIAVWWMAYSKVSSDQPLVDKLTGYVLDVGQGDAIYLHFPQGEEVLIDGGPDTRVLGELAKVMKPMDKTIDLLIASHQDADHIGGIDDLLRAYSVKEIWWNGLKKETGAFSRFQTEIDKEKSSGATVKEVTAGEGKDYHCLNQTPEKSCQTGLKVIYPLITPVDGTPSNQAGVVIKAFYNNSCVLLTGDIEAPEEQEMVSKYGQDLDCDVLKVAHHGSSTSSSSSFLSAVSPKLALISVGKGNSYGHPRAEVLERISGLQAKIIRTDESGRIEFLLPD